jgi:TolB-like protein/Tfp pilus assembly protein PilF
VVRRGLVDFSGLVAGDDQISLDVDSYRADAHDLEDLADREGASAPDIALKSFTGVFMDGFSLREPAFQEWLEEERRRCRGLAQAVLRRRLVRLEDEGSLDDAIGVARLLLALDPLQEDIHRSLMRIFMADGRIGDAARQYEECRDVLRRELDLLPDRETDAQVATIRAHRVPVQKPTRPPGPTPVVRPSLATVAILPFMGTPAGHASGLASDVMHLLSAWRHLAVIDRATMSSQAVRSTSARDIHDELGANYVVQGEMRERANRVRWRVDLVDAPTGSILWTGTFAVRGSPNGEEDTALARRITAHATHEIERAEALRTRIANSGRLGPWEYFQRGRALHGSHLWESHQQAKAMFKRALDLDPAFTPAMAALARAYHDDYTNFHLAGDSIPRCVETARRAIELDDLDSMAHLALSLGACRSHDHRLAVDEGHKAIRLNPSSAHAHVASGNALSIAGKPTAGAARIKKGLALMSPYDSCGSFCAQMVARSYLTARDHGAAVKWAEKSIRQRPNWAFSHFVRASALAQLRRWTEAEAAIEQCLAVDSGCVNWEFSQSAARYANPADHHHILDGVRQLGFG